MEQQPQITILAISGSLRARSSNNAVITVAATFMPINVHLEIYEGLGDLPHFNDSVDPPQQVVELRTKIKAADGVFICSPEYAFGVPGSLKNALDWTVSTGEFVSKPVALITAATGGDKAHASLLLTLGAISARIPDGAALLISFIRSKMDASGAVTNVETLDAIKSVVNTLVTEIEASQQTG